MIICNVIGNVISTRKNEKLTGCKLLMLKQWQTGDTFAAVDNIGAGAGEWVLAVRGVTAMTALGGIPTDAAVVGIIDEESCRSWNLQN